jgi:hypothetical protein
MFQIASWFLLSLVDFACRDWRGYSGTIIWGDGSLGAG